jgi:hypothetical protein
MNLINKIKQHIKEKQNYKLFAKLEPTVLKFLYNRLGICDIVSSAYEITIKYDGLYENKDINIKLIIKSYVNILQIEYKNKKLFKKYSKTENLHIMLIEMLIGFNKTRSNESSNKKHLDPKSEKLEKLNKTLESYQNQYNDILKWEKLNGKTHQDRLMVTSMIENVKDKIKKISNKTV